jgi:DNA-binding Lrp family transcriptional regulator
VVVVGQRDLGRKHYNVYDIIARVEADTMEKVKETITWKIRRLDRVRSTLTMIVEG